MKGGTVIRVEPVAWIKGEEINLCSLGELRRLFHYEPAIVDAGF